MTKSADASISETAQKVGRAAATDMALGAKIGRLPHRNRAGKGGKTAVLSVVTTIAKG